MNFYPNTSYRISCMTYRISCMTRMKRINERIIISNFTNHRGAIRILSSRIVPTNEDIEFKSIRNRANQKNGETRITISNHQKTCTRHISMLATTFTTNRNHFTTNRNHFTTNRNHFTTTAGTNARTFNNSSRNSLTK
jgi:hypothetical protein